MNKILIVYCSPDDQERLRIDREHRAIDEAIREANIQPTVVIRKQAVTIRDLIDSLSQENYSVIQFSGHGTDQSIIFDSDLGLSEELPIDELLGILKETQKSLRLVLLLSCFSFEMAERLHECSPHVISVKGEASDQAIVKFVEFFYHLFLKHWDVGQAFSLAHRFIKNDVQIVHTRKNPTSNVVCIAIAVGFHQTGEVYVDLTEAEPSITALNVPRDEFLRILTRKIRVHRNIFTLPKEQATLSVGPYIGVFSWATGNDVVCHRVLKIREGIPSQFIEAWADYSVSYNDCTMEKYRLVSEPSDPTNRKLLSVALAHFEETFRSYFTISQLEPAGMALSRDIYLVAKASIRSYLREAKSKIRLQMYAEAVPCLESALSAFHDVLDGIAVCLTRTDEDKPSNRLGA